MDSTEGGGGGAEDELVGGSDITDERRTATSENPEGGVKST